MRAKPGYLTSEFWLTVAVNAAALISAIQSYLPPRWSLVAGSLVTGLYAISRGWAKTNPAAPSIPPALPKVTFTQPVPPPQP
jgi:hypothetical protein